MRTMKFLCALIAFIMLMTAAAGCQGGEAGAKKTGGPAQEISLEFWTIGLKNAFGDYIQGLIDRYQNDHPNIKIEWVDVPGAEVESKFLVSLTSGNPPDLANIYGASKYVAQNALVNLEKKVPKEKREEYFEGFWYGLSSNKNESYGIPWYASASVLFYNKEIFKAAGLDPEAPPKTFEEALQASRVIKQKTGKYGMAIETHNANFTPWMNTIFIPNGIKLFNDDKTKAVLNNEESLKTLKMWIDAYQEGIIPPEVLNLTGSERDPINWYIEERTAMLVAGGWIERLMNENIKEKIGIAPPLLGSLGKAMLGYQYLVVPTQSKHQDEAIDFGLFITNSENVLEFCKLVAILPTTKKAAQDEFFKKEPETIGERANQIATRILDIGMIYNEPIEGFAEYQEILKESISKAMLKTVTPEQALAEIETKWNELLAKKK